MLPGTDRADATLLFREWLSGSFGSLGFSERIALTDRLWLRMLPYRARHHGVWSTVLLSPRNKYRPTRQTMSDSIASNKYS